MSLAQRVRDYRYSKGWGPDELANRAEISRTALYQIESGKTELPRAGTLRRIAVALEVPMEDLLGHEDEPIEMTKATTPSVSRGGRVFQEWVPAEGGPLSMPSVSAFKPHMSEDHRFGIDHSVPHRSNGHDAVYLREGELMSKLHDLIHSPVGEGVARLVEELHTLIPRNRASI